MSITKIREVFSLPNVHYAYLLEYDVIFFIPTYDVEFAYRFCCLWKVRLERHQTRSVGLFFYFYLDRIFG